MDIARSSSSKSKPEISLIPVSLNLFKTSGARQQIVWRRGNQVALCLIIISVFIYVCLTMCICCFYNNSSGANCRESPSHPRSASHRLPPSPGLVTFFFLRFCHNGNAVNILSGKRNWTMVNGGKKCQVGT